MKVLSFNVGIWTRNTSKEDYFWKSRANAMNKMISDIEPDVICMQELIWPMTNYIPNNYKKAGLGVSHHIYINKKTVSVKCHKFLYNIDYAYIEYKNEKKCIINVHSHWDVDKITKNINQINDIVSKAIEDGYNDIICCGDFNNDLDTLNNLSVKINLINVRDYLNLPKENTFIHFYKDSASEIDFFYINNTKRISSFRIVKEADTNYGVNRMSDHLPILYVEK